MNIRNRKSSGDGWDDVSILVRAPAKREQDPVEDFLDVRRGQGAADGQGFDDPSMETLVGPRLPSAEELVRIAAENAERERVLADLRREEERLAAEAEAEAERKALAEKEKQRVKEDREREDLAYTRQKEIEDKTAQREYDSQNNALTNAAQAEARENMKTLERRAEEDKADKSAYELAEKKRKYNDIEAVREHTTKLSEEFYANARAKAKTVLIIGATAFALYAMFKIAATDWTQYMKRPEAGKDPIAQIEKNPGQPIQPPQPLQPKIQFQPQEPKGPGNARNGPVPDGNGGADNQDASKWGWDKYKLSPE